MPTAAIDLNAQYTWQDYREWDDSERWELINGAAHAMSPAPSEMHQDIVGGLYRQMADFFDDNPGKVFVAPLDVKLSDLNVVQPDILVVCDEDKRKGTHIEGAPDLVVEVVSPSSVRRDRIEKMNIYAHCGVREYWLVTPEAGIIEVMVLSGDSYRVAPMDEKCITLKSTIFPDMTINLCAVFPDSQLMGSVSV